MADGMVRCWQRISDKIPVVESDYIFAAITEESGLLGAALGLLLLYVQATYVRLVTAARAKSDVSSFCNRPYLRYCVASLLLVVSRS